MHSLKRGNQPSRDKECLMNITVDMVRRLAKLDPGVREIFYSFVDEFEKEQDKFLTKQDLIDLTKKIEELGKWGTIAEDLSKIKEHYKSLESRFEEHNKKIDTLISEFNSMSSKLESILDANKEMVKFLESKQDIDLSEVKDLISENTKGMSHIIYELKDKLEGVNRIISSKVNDKILSKLSKALKKRVGINVKKHFTPKLFDVKGEKISFPIFGIGTKNKKTHSIVGKIISSPTSKDVDNFIEQVEFLIREKQLPQLVCKVLVVEQIEEEIEKQAEKRGISIIWTQDL